MYKEIYFHTPLLSNCTPFFVFIHVELQNYTKYIFSFTYERVMM